MSGWGAAMLINVVLWPPRYNQALKGKLRQANEAAVLYFCRAVQEYVGLEGSAQPQIEPEEKKRIYKLNKEARQFFGVFVYDKYRSR